MAGMTSPGKQESHVTRAWEEPTPRTSLDPTQEVLPNPHDLDSIPGLCWGGHDFSCVPAFPWPLPCRPRTPPAAIEGATGQGNWPYLQLSGSPGFSVRCSLVPSSMVYSGPIGTPQLEPNCNYFLPGSNPDLQHRASPQRFSLGSKVGTEDYRS